MGEAAFGQKHLPEVLHKGSQNFRQNFDEPVASRQKIERNRLKLFKTRDIFLWPGFGGAQRD